MARFDGTLLQFRCDEKGFVGVCAFGLRSQCRQEDRSDRAVAAALEVVRLLNDSGAPPAADGSVATQGDGDAEAAKPAAKPYVCIGVTTGELLCTCVGATGMRLDYTVFGDAINLSARLSQVRPVTAEKRCSHSSPRCHFKTSDSSLCAVRSMRVFLQQHLVKAYPRSVFSMAYRCLLVYCNSISPSSPPSWHSQRSCVLTMCTSCLPCPPQAAVGDPLLGAIVCDMATQEKARKAAAYEELPSLVLKGKQAAVRVWKVLPPSKVGAPAAAQPPLMAPCFALPACAAVLLRVICIALASARACQPRLTLGPGLCRPPKRRRKRPSCRGRSSAAARECAVAPRWWGASPNCSPSATPSAGSWLVRYQHSML